MLDYLLVSKDIAALVHDVATVSDAPWSPHLGISFRINARPHAVRTMQLQRPSNLLPARNVDGKICSWTVPFDTWESAKREVAGTGSKAVTEMLTKMPDIKSYIDDLGIEAQTTRLAARYYEWSRAAERSIIAATGTDNDKRLTEAGSNRVLGRGCLPYYRLQSIALPLLRTDRVGHAMWNEGQNAAQGPDLYSTLWATIANILKDIAHARKLDIGSTM